jgi:hypothetical protein
MRKKLLAVLSICLLVLSAHAIAQNNDSGRTESTQANQTSKVSEEKKEPVKTPEKAPQQETPAVTPVAEQPKPVEPTPAPIDPNGCEAKGMWWRADNYECIPKTAPVSAPTPVPAAQVVVASAGSGDCSLVNGYDWPTGTAMRVCMQESGGNPNNANWADNHTSWAGCMGSFGLFQINCSHGQVYDGAKNVAIAYNMWKGSGGSFWKNWPNTCRKVGC